MNPVWVLPPLQQLLPRPVIQSVRLWSPVPEPSGILLWSVPMTGLVLVSSIMKNPAIDMSTVTDGGLLTTLAFSSRFLCLGPVILVVGIISFAFSTVLGWAYYGERCVEYFAGQKGLIPYQTPVCCHCSHCPCGSPLNLVWTSSRYPECSDGGSQT